MTCCTPHKTPGTGPLRNGNHRGDPNSAPRCGAKTRAGTACKSPAMKNGRCRMHGGKCRGPTTQEGRDRISAARDQGKGWSKKWKPINDAHAAIVRRGRVFAAMADARIAFAEVAPLIRDLRRTIGQADPGYPDGSPASAALYACEAVLGLSGDRPAMRALTQAIREAGRLRRAARRPPRSVSEKTQKNALHRETARAAPKMPPTTPPALGRPDPSAKNAERMPCTVSTLPPSAPLNRKQRRRLAKFTATSHAPRAARHMTQPPVSAKRPP